ncbi:MAG: lipoprotein [Comamonas sp.]
MCSSSRSILFRGRARVWPVAMLLAALLAGCGQSGPLYMPDKPPPSQVPRIHRTPAATTATPATGDSSSTDTQADTQAP